MPNPSEITREESPVIPPPDPRIDKAFMSWGGVPEKVDNWQAVALTAIDVFSKSLLLLARSKGKS